MALIFLFSFYTQLLIYFLSLHNSVWSLFFESHKVHMYLTKAQCTYQYMYHHSFYMRLHVLPAFFVLPVIDMSSLLIVSNIVLKIKSPKLTNILFHTPYKYFFCTLKIFICTRIIVCLTLYFRNLWPGCVSSRVRSIYFLPSLLVFYLFHAKY